jgi:hypothetical protein
MHHPPALVQGDHPDVDLLFGVDEHGVAEEGFIHRRAVSAKNLEKHPVQMDRMEASGLIGKPKPCPSPLAQRQGRARVFMIRQSFAIDCPFDPVLAPSPSAEPEVHGRRDR